MSSAPSIARLAPLPGGQRPWRQHAAITTAIEQIKHDTGVPLIASVFGYALIAEQAKMLLPADAIGHGGGDEAAPGDGRRAAPGEALPPSPHRDRRASGRNGSTLAHVWRLPRSPLRRGHAQWGHRRCHLSLGGDRPPDPGWRRPAPGGIIEVVLREANAAEETQTEAKGEGAE